MGAALVIIYGDQMWEEQWEGVVVIRCLPKVITDVDGDSGCDMFTHVVTATPGSVLTYQCYKEWYSYLV